MGRGVVIRKVHRGSHQKRTCQAGDQIQLFCAYSGEKVKIKAKRTGLAPKKGLVELRVNVSSLLFILLKKGRGWEYNKKGGKKAGDNWQ